MDFVALVVSIVAACYMASRVNGLEAQVKSLKKKIESGTGVSNSTSAPRPVVSAPAPMPLASVSPLSAMPTMPPPRPVAMPVATTPTTPKTSTTSAADEFNFGSKILTIVGVIAVFLGIIFFLRYAFENNIITPFYRVALGVAFGIVVASIGASLRKKFASYGLALIGAGFGIIYISFYSAYGFYDLLPLPTAVALMIIVTAISTLFAISLDSLPLVLFSFLGAFIVPFIMPITASVHLIFGYILILVLAIVGISSMKRWPELVFVGLIGTAAISYRWLSFFSAGTSPTTISFYLTVIFIAFFIANVFTALSRDYSPKEVDKKSIESFLLSAVPVMYVLLSLTVYHAKDDVALLTLLVGLFYIIGSVIVRMLYRNNPRAVSISNIFVVIGTLGIVLATSLHFEGRTLSSFLVIEATAIVTIGVLLRAHVSRALGLLLTAASAAKVIFFDIHVVPVTVPIFNERTLLCALVVLMYAVIWSLYRYGNYAPGQGDGAIASDEKELMENYASAALFVVPVIWMSLEMNRLPHPLVYLPFAWMAFIALMISLAFMLKENVFKIFSYILFTISIIISFAYTLNLPVDLYQPFLNVRMLNMVVVIALISYIIALFDFFPEDATGENRDMRKIFIFIGNAIPLIFISKEIMDYFNTNSSEFGASAERVALSAFWLAYAIVGLFVGIAKRSRFARLLSLVLFVVVVFKIFLFDTYNLSDVYRFVSYISLGVILLLASYFYYRFKDRITQFVQVDGGQTPVSEVRQNQ